MIARNYKINGKKMPQRNTKYYLCILGDLHSYWQRSLNDSKEL